MKHLKKYKIFESEENLHDVVSVIKDMSLDLTDEDPNYIVNVYSNSTVINWNQARLCIDLFYQDDRMFVYNNELINFLERLNAYLIDKGFNPSDIRYSKYPYMIGSTTGEEEYGEYEKCKDMNFLINKITESNDEKNIDSIRMTYRPINSSHLKVPLT